MDVKKLMQCVAIKRKEIRMTNANRVFYNTIPEQELFEYYNYGIASPLVEEWLRREDVAFDLIQVELFGFDLETQQQANKLIKARREKARRVRKRIDDIMKNDALFLTFTFTDEILASTTFEKRKRYIKDWLGKLNCPYVANLDYGKKNGREHYHAVVGISSVDFDTYTFGNLYGEKIRVGSNSIALSRYIVKLTAHCLKDTARTIIYSRTKK